MIGATPSVPLMIGATPSVPLMIGATPSVPLMIGATPSIPLMIGATPLVPLMIGAMPSVPLMKQQRPKSKKKKIGRKKVVPTIIPCFEQSVTEQLCSLTPQLSLAEITTLDNDRNYYKTFFRGCNQQDRDIYNKELFETIGVDKCLGKLTSLPLDKNLAINFSDGTPCIYVFRNATPPQLTEHFFHAASSLGRAYQHCSIRHVQCAHLGGKEFNPGENQMHAYEGIRNFILDKGITKQHVTLFLPELLFADKVAQIVSPEIHAQCLLIDENYRLAQTGFTQFTANTTDCSIHHDLNHGLDVLLYAGEWHGGALEIPQLDLKIELKMGDIVVMDSILFHQVERIAGKRFSLVFYSKNHNEVSTNGNILLVPTELHWLSKKYFGMNI